MMRSVGRVMKIYGLFSGGRKEPMQTYYGDEMVLNKEYVYLYRRERRQGSPIPKQVLVAAIHLGLGQSVKEISGSQGASSHSAKQV